MVMIGREAVPQGAVDDDLLLEAEGLAAAAMRADPPLEDWIWARRTVCWGLSWADVGKSEAGQGSRTVEATPYTKKGRIAPPLSFYFAVWTVA